MLFRYISILALAVSQALATDRPDVSSVLWSCYYSLTPYNFTCDPSQVYPATDDYYACSCSNDGLIVSIMHCAVEQVPKVKKYNPDNVLNALLHYCRLARPELDRSKLNTLYNSFGPEDYLNATNLDEETPLTTPIIVNEDDIFAYYKTTEAFYYNQYHGEEYGGYMLLYMAVVVLIASIFNFMKNFTPGFVKSCQTNSLVMVVRKKFANPACGGYKHSTPSKWGPYEIFNSSIPTRVQTWVCIGYFAMFVIFNCVGINGYTEGNLWYDTRRLAIGRAVGDRSGIIATTQLPLIYLFAGRNNFTLWLTGWSYDTMSAYHRWTSRIMYLGVFIHSVAYTDFELAEDSLADIWARIFMRWGIAATILVSFVLLFSHRYFRENHYEFFLGAHWIFVVFFTIGTFYHVNILNYGNWAWAAIGVWAFDHVVRIVRIIIAGYSKADVVALPDDYIRMKIKYSNLWNIKTGQYIFIHYLKPLWGCWQSHPFTCYPSPIPGEEKMLVVVYKVRGGITKTISQLVQNNNNQLKMSVLIDGPYGQHFPIAKNDSMLFIAGGIGFPATYSYASRLKSHSEKKRVVFLWITRNHEHVEMFRDELQYLTKDSSIDVQIYLTGETSLGKSYSLEKETSDKAEGQEVTEKISLSSSNGISYTLGKPDLTKVISEAVAESSGSIGVMVCGPPSMNDTIRKVTVDNLDKGSKQVNLYVESYNW